MGKEIQPRSPSTFERGRAGEALAERFLVDLGLELIERNFRWRGGEIDLVMRNRGAEPSRDILVFVEVRSSTEVRSRIRFSIGAEKRARLLKTIALYPRRRQWARGHGFRFDLIWVEGGAIEHWPNVILS